MSHIEASPELLSALQKMSSLLESENALKETLQTVVDLSVSSVPGCDSAGVTLMIAGKERTAAASDEYTLEIDNIQYDTDEGPCVEALHSGVTITVETISDETRWPEFCRRAESKGLMSSVSQPLSQNGNVGALNIYSTTERAFDETSIQVAGIFAQQASIALKNAQTYEAARRLAEHLNVALESRDVIGAAKGILMEREGLSGEEAFEMLTKISQHSNVKLRDIAQKVVEEKKLEIRSLEDSQGSRTA